MVIFTSNKKLSLLYNWRLQQEANIQDCQALFQIDESCNQKKKKDLHDILFNNLSKVMILVISINFSSSIHIFHKS